MFDVANASLYDLYLQNSPTGKSALLYFFNRYYTSIMRTSSKDWKR